MAEYIERNAAQEVLLNFMKEAAREGVKPDQVRAIRYAAYELKKVPAADVVEVVHGRWIPFHSQAAGCIQFCSACEIGCTWQPNYCPNCGARMRGAEDE